MLAAVGDIATEWYCDAGRRAQFIQELLAQGRVVDFVSQVYRHKTRERIWIREHAHQVCDDQGRVLYFEGTVQDITDAHQTRLDLEASESRFRAMTELSCDWYWELDVAFRFVRQDVGKRSFSSGVDYKVLGKTMQELAHIALGEARWKRYQVLLDSHQTFHDFEFPVRATHGGLVWQSISGEPMFDAQGEFAGYRGIGRDVTARRQSEELIRQMAFHDALTGLANRRLFMDRLQQALASLARSGQCGALMFLDLDTFKALNDLHGHLVGDEMLHQVAQRLKACVRGVDTVARIGGDEFTILLVEAGATAELATRHARAVAEKILQALQVPFVLDDTPSLSAYQGSASLGVAILEDGQAGSEACLKRADAAMYLAKSSGRNRICFDVDA